MTDPTTRTGTVHLTERTPTVSGPEMLASLVPPPQFDDATFDSYRADPAYPSQEEAKQTLLRFAGRGAPVKRGGLFSRAKKEPELKPGVYLDGGFGVGKTHLLASIYHAMPARRKYFGSFIEYTALVGHSATRTPWTSSKAPICSASTSSSSTIRATRWS